MAAKSHQLHIRIETSLELYLEARAKKADKDKSEIVREILRAARDGDTAVSDDLAEMKAALTEMRSEIKNLSAGAAKSEELDAVKKNVNTFFHRMRGIDKNGAKDDSMSIIALHAKLDELLGAQREGGQ